MATLAHATPTSWSADPALAWVVAVVVLYWLGGRHRTGTSARGADRWRTAAFYAGLATIVVAVGSPIDHLAEELLGVHMVQHVLLMLVAPPLLALGRPWNRIWRGLPLDLRRGIARALARGRYGRRVRTAAHGVGTPLASWLLFNLTLVAWHLPFAYDSTLHSPVAHALEHAMFFGAGLLFWTRLIDSPPWRSPLGELARATYATLALIVGWALAVVLALAPEPLYSAYAGEAARPGGISALADQRLAAGVMWVPGSIPLTIVALAALARWLDPRREDPPGDRTAAARSP